MFSLIEVIKRFFNRMFSLIERFFNRMFSLIKKIIFKYFIESLYIKYEPYYFPLMSKAPYFLNYAYPDFSVQYFISTFTKKETITIKGIIPISKINFFCITLYDTNGLPYYSKNDYMINILNDVSENLEYQEIFEVKESSALILRFYIKNKYENYNFYNYLPTISTPKKLDYLNIKSNSIKLEDILQYQLSKLDNIVNSAVLKKNYFYKPDKSKLKNLFPNENAEYLIAFPKTKIVLIKIKTEIFCRDDFRFIGFMASNYKTTGTDSSISLEEGNKEYRIWVCYPGNINNLITHPNDKILYWNNNNEFPILVYREVRIKKEGLQKLDQEVGPDQLRTMMNYPEIEYY